MKGDKIQINNPELVEELLKREVDFTVWKKLGLLNALANCKTSFEQAARLFDVPHSTAYEWIRKWNKDGYDGLLFKHDSERGRPSKLSDENVRCLEELLKEKNYWQTSEVVELISERFGVRLSQHQVRRILRDKLRMNFSKPYPKDYRRPDNAEELLSRQLELSCKYLMEAKGYWFEEIALGFADESAPQLTANTVRVWSFGKPEMKKNTQKMKANTVGFYALRGTSVREFTADSKTESFVGFLRRVREENSEYKAVVVVLDNFSTHKARRVREEAEGMGIYLTYLPPYSPDLNPIESIWKGIKRVVSVSFVKHLDNLKQIVGHTFDCLSKRLNFAKSWVDKFLSWLPFAMEDYALNYKSTGSSYKCCYVPSVLLVYRSS